MDFSGRLEVQHDWFDCGFKNLAVDKSVVALKLLL